MERLCTSALYVEAHVYDVSCAYSMGSLDVRKRFYWVAFTLLELLLPTNLFGGSPGVILLADANSPLVQNQRADYDDLSRMRNAAMVRRFAQSGYLVRIASSDRHFYLHDIPAAYQYARPWTKLFLTRLSRQYHARFEKRLRVTSLVRTEGRQRRLAQINLNAASAKGALRSSHLTGATIDISKRFMTQAEAIWIRSVLYSLHRQGYIYAVEEFEQPVFHVMVYRSYPKYVSATRRVSKRAAKAASQLRARTQLAVDGRVGESLANDASTKIVQRQR